MLSLPITGSPLREMFDVQCLLKPLELPTFRQALVAARNSFAADRAARSVQSVCVRADGTIELVQFGPRGGKRTLWTFGAA